MAILYQKEFGLLENELDSQPNITIIIQLQYLNTAPILPKLNLTNNQYDHK